jgi:hypothetical protein
MIHRLKHGKLVSTVRAWTDGAMARRQSCRSRASLELSPLMLAKLASYALVGIDAMPFEVEADVKGRDYAKRALVIAAVRGHDVSTLWAIPPSEYGDIRPCGFADFAFRFDSSWQR